MKKPYLIRSDFADEFVRENKEEKTYIRHENEDEWIKTNYIQVLEEENELHKEKGDYVSIECKHIDDYEARMHMMDQMVECLNKMCRNMHLNLAKILVVGLGNRFITSDALGPGVVDKLLVTAHLYANEDPSQLKGTRNVAVLQPGVMGQTGLESKMIIESVANNYQPNLILVIDALATRNIERINRVIQINNTGIQPGSGVHNPRLALNEESLHVPVIALGVATVTSIGAILKEAFDSEEVMNRFDEQQMNLIVTPKSIDEEIATLISILSRGLNVFLHPDFEEL